MNYLLNIEKVSQNNIELAISLQKEIFVGEESPQQFYEGIKTDNPQNFICYYNNVPVGIVGLYYQANLPEHALLNWFGIIPSQRNKGFATKSLDLIIIEARKKNKKYLTFWTDTYENANAINLYKKYGFTVCNYCCQEDISLFTKNGIKNTFSIGVLKLNNNAKDVDFSKINMKIDDQYKILNQNNNKKVDIVK